MVSLAPGQFVPDALLPSEPLGLTYHVVAPACTPVSMNTPITSAARRNRVKIILVWKCWRVLEYNGHILVELCAVSELIRACREIIEVGDHPGMGWSPPDFPGRS